VKLRTSRFGSVRFSGWLLASLSLSLSGRVLAQEPEPSASQRPEPAPADPARTKLICAHAYEMSQRLRQGGQLQKAREQALICAQTSCPAVLTGDCTNWLGQLDSAIPSVIVDVRDARGQAVTSGLSSVSVDEQPLAGLLDGRAVPLDPGQRRFRITLADGRRLERTVIVTEGQKGQVVRFDAAPTPVARAAPRLAGPSSALTAGAATAGLLGGIGFAYFSLQGRADERRLEASCAPRCSESAVGSLQRTYLAADVSLGVSVAALAFLSYSWLTSDGDHAASKGVGAAVSSHGAALSFRESF
jgi:hypothetical protein